MGWNPAVGQRVRIVSQPPGPRLPADRMTGRVVRVRMWTRGNVRPFRLYDVRLDHAFGVMWTVSVTREAIVFVPRSPHRKKSVRNDSTRPRRRA